jgi:hypothetical protein
LNQEGSPALPEQSNPAQGQQAEANTTQPEQQTAPIQEKSDQQNMPITDQPGASAVTKDVYVVNQPVEMRSQQLVELPNGDFIAFSNQMTLGDAITSAGLFLILAFLVLQWLLKLSTGRG